MRRMISAVLVCFLLCGCIALNDDISSSVDVTESTITDISDVSSDVLSDVSSDESSNGNPSINNDIITSSTNSQDISSIIESSNPNNSNAIENNTSSVSSTTNTLDENQITGFPLGKGNSFANIVNSEGLMAYGGDWIFYSNKSDSGALYKIRTDGTENQRIGTDIQCSYINVVGDWIVYKCAKKRSGLDVYIYEIVKIKTNGTEREVLTSGWAITYAYVSDKKLYYSLGANRSDASVYVMDLDTKKSTKYDENILPTTQHYAILPYFDDEWIYFLDSYNSTYRYGTLCKMKIDGTEKIQLTNNVVRKFDVYNGWIYYLDYNFGISRVKIDGTEDAKVFSDEHFSAFSVTDEGIFASSGQLFKINHDGSNYEMFSVNIAMTEFFFTVTNEHIYFVPNSEDGKYNKIKRIDKNADANNIGELMPFNVNW